MFESSHPDKKEPLDIPVALFAYGAFLFLVGVLAEELEVAGDGAAAGFVQVFAVFGQGDDLVGRGDADVGALEFGILAVGAGFGGEDLYAHVGGVKFFCFSLYGTSRVMFVVSNKSN